MTASLIPVSHGEPMVFTKDDAAAVWLFFLTNTADGSPATGKTIATTDFKISKAGAAFGNAAGAVTEISLGWYKMAWAAADLSALGPLACELSGEAGVDPIHCVHQVQALNVNVATVNPGANGITAATIADGAIDAATFSADASATLQTPLLTRTSNPFAIAGATGDPAMSMVDAIDCVITASGDFGGGSLQPQTCEDPKAAVPEWTNSGAALAAAGSKTITGPHNAVRAHFTGGTAAAVSVVFAQRKPASIA